MTEKKDTINVSATAKKVENDKTAKQKESADEIRRKQKEAEVKAAAMRKEAEDRKVNAELEAKKKKEEEQAKKEKEAKEKEMLAMGAAAIAAAGKASKGKGKIKTFLLGLVLGLVLGAIGMRTFLEPSLPHTTQGSNENTVVVNENLLSQTIEEIEGVVMGAAVEHQELIVMEQPLEISTTLTKAGLGGLEIFSKYQNITYYGTGVYTVDLSHIDKSHIRVNNDTHVVSVTIPHTVLQYINPDLDKTEFSDTGHGLLSFGDIKLTPEEQNQIQQSIELAMREKLDTPEQYELADEFAALKTWEIFQPLIASVAPEYTVEMVFE